MFLNKFILSICLVLSFSIKSFANELFLLPKQNKEALNHIEKLILNSKKDIKIAVYNFSNKKLLKALIKAKKNGINIVVYIDKNKAKENKKVLESLNENKIKTIITKNKLHTKLAIFDGKIAYFGSANWTKKSFSENYEVLYFTSDRNLINNFEKFIDNIN